MMLPKVKKARMMVTMRVVVVSLREEAMRWKNSMVVVEDVVERD